MILSMTTAMISLLLATQPQAAEAQHHEAAERVENQIIAQVYEYETEGDRVRVKYRPRGWFDYFPRYPLAPEYEDVPDYERERYPESRDDSAQENYLVPRDNPVQEEYTERRDNPTQEQYTEREGTQ
jgi:hypothetical protein